MKHSGILFCLVLMGFLSACTLEDPPECHTGNEKCIDNVLGRGLYYVCGTDGKWNMPTSCVSECNGTTCGVFEDSRSCSVEGESQCLSYPEGNLSLVCQNGQWIMGLCNGVCINPATSRDFCGADSKCENYQTCGQNAVCSYDTVSSQYACQCDSGAYCDNACYDLSSTLEHCGDCNQNCTQLEGWVCCVNSPIHSRHTSPIDL